MSGIRDALRKARMLDEGQNLNEKDYQHSYSRISEKHFAIKIHSEILGKDIWLVTDEEMEKDLNDALVAYLPPEIKHIVKLRATPEEVKKIHMIKETFPGSKIVWN